MPQSRCAVILAAGKGTRMKSARSKVLHEVGGKPMLAWAVEAARACGVERVVVVYGEHAPDVAELAQELGCETALQDPPLGTGHAVLAAREAMADETGAMIVLYADTPMLPAETLQDAFASVDAGASVAVLGFEIADGGGYGRLVTSADGGLERIVEAKDASDDELAIGLCNSGVMAGPARLMFELLGEVKNDNAKGEYYLTDIVGLARDRGLGAQVVRGAFDDFLGVNSRVELAACEALFQARAREAALINGVTMIDPGTVYFSYDTEIGADVVIEPNVVFRAGVRVEEGATVRAFSHLEGAHVRAGASVGPYARLRPGADIGPGAFIGNFVEVKNTTLAAGAKASHLTYLGDAEVGEKANIGAGTITCNYDGFAKHKTIIGAGAFIGSDTALVAPVRIGAGAFTGSGSVITRDVPDDALAVARGRQRDIEGWAKKFRDAQPAKKK